MSDQTQSEDSPEPAQPTERIRSRGFGVGDLIGGRYRITGSLGMGGMAVVYAAHDEELGVDVAVKLLWVAAGGDERTQERFRRELLLSRQVSHRNVVRIHDLGQHDGQMFITMDLVRGSSLREILDRDGALPLDQALDWFRQALRGIRAAHQAGVVHRDLKPANLLIADDRVLISDFGIAQSAGADHLTATGMVVGTLDYLSPEQALGATVDERSDLYALGLILYEMLRGELGEGHSDGSLSERLAQRIVADEAKRPAVDASVPRRVKDVIEKLLRRDPDDRFRSADEVLRALEGDLAQPLVDAAGPVGSPRHRRLRGRLAAAAAVVALAAVPAAMWWAGSSADPEEAPDTDGPATLVAGSQSVALVPSGNDDTWPWVDWTARRLHDRLIEDPNVRVVDPDRLNRLLRDLEIRSERWSASRMRQLAELLDVDRVVVLHLDGAGQRFGLLTQAFESVTGELVEVGTAEGEKASDLMSTAVNGLADRYGWQMDSARDEEFATSEVILDVGAARRALNEGEPNAALTRLERVVAKVDEPALAALRLTLARTLFAAGEFDRGERVLDELLDALEGRDAPPDRMLRARALLALGRTDEAIAACERALASVPTALTLALECAEGLGDGGHLARARSLLGELTSISPGYGRAWYLLGKFSIIAGESRVAVDDYLVRALVAENRVGDEQGRADVHNALGVGLRQLGELEAAEQNYETAAQLRREVGDLAGYATTLRNLALIATFRGESERAEQRLREGLEIFRDLGDRRGQASMVNDLGVLAEEQGDYREALDLYTETLRLYREAGSAAEIAQSLNNVGFAYYLLGDFEHGLAFARQALERSEAEGDPFPQALALQAMGQLHLASGEWPDAERAYRRALELGRQMEDPGVEAVSLGQLGRLAFEQGRFAESLIVLAEALDVLDSLGDLRGLVEYRLAETEVRLALGDWEQALELLDELKDSLAAVENLEQMSRAASLRARVAQQRGRRSEVERWATEAVRRARESGSDRTLLESELDQASLLGAAPEAAEQLEQRARRLGHARMRLLALEVLARSLVDTGRLEEARGVLADGMRFMRRTVGAWRRYHVLLGLRLESEPDMAQQERLRIAASLEGEVARLTEELDESSAVQFLNDPDNRRALESGTSPEGGAR